MQVSSIVKKETKRMALGELILCAIMVAVFVLLRKFDYTVLLGAIVGGSFAVFNFYLLARTVEKAAAGDEITAKMKMRSSHIGRMFLTFAVGALAISLPYFNWITVLLPLLFPRIIVFLLYLLKIEPKEE